MSVQHWVDAPDVSSTVGVAESQEISLWDTEVASLDLLRSLEPPAVPYIFDLENCPFDPIRRFVPLHEQTRTTLQSLRLVLYKYAMVMDKAHNTDKKPTHTALNDGKFYVDSANEAIFDRAVATALSAGYRLFFNEISTRVFRFFCDLDFEQAVTLRNIHVEAVALVVQNTVKDFFDAPDSEQFFKCIVCAAPPKKLSNGSVKTGIHLIFCNIFVVQSQAILMRELIICNLQKHLGRRVGVQNSWDDVVDLSVYQKREGACLRMVGHCKVSPCGVCRGKKPAVMTCENCFQLGRVDEGRPYMPMFVLGSEGTRDVVAEREYLHDMVKLVQDTKIRNTELDPDEVEGSARAKKPPLFGFKGPDSMPLSQTDFDDLVAPTPTTTSAAARPKSKVVGGSRYKPIDLDEKSFQNLQSFMRSSINKNYNDLLIKDILVSTKKDTYLVHVRGPGVLYCQNVSREHRSNNIYFEINMTGMCQRCFKSTDNSTESTNRVSCKDYRSKPKRLPSDVMNALFPSDTSSSSASVVAATDDTGTIVPASRRTNVYRFPWSSSSDVRVRKSAEAQIGSLLGTLDTLSKSLGFTKSVSTAMGWSFDFPAKDAIGSDELGSLGITELRKTLGYDDELESAEEPDDSTHFRRFELSEHEKIVKATKIKTTKDLVMNIMKDLARPAHAEAFAKAIKKLKRSWSELKEPSGPSGPSGPSAPKTTSFFKFVE